MKNCLVCENIKNENQFKSCWLLYREELIKIIKKAESKISTVSEELSKCKIDDPYTPPFYIDSSLKNLCIDYCFYEYLEERLLKYYFFIQRNLEHIFYKWAYFHNDKVQAITFSAVDNWSIFKSIKGHKNFSYLELVWALANLYKHNSQRAEKSLEELIIKDKHLKNIEINFYEVTNKVIEMFDDLFAKIK